MISVIIATKNGEKYIARAIQSVLDQTYAVDEHTKDLLEILVVSDGSTDKTAQVVETLRQKDARIQFISLPQNIGPGLARNIGIEKARGEYIAFIDDDDIWISKDKLRLQKDFLDTHSEYVLVGANKVHIVNEEGRQLYIHINRATDAEIRHSMLLRNCFANSSVLFKKKVFEQAGKFKAMYLAEDYDLWLRMAKLGKVANLTDCDIAYTKRFGNASTTREKEMYVTILKLVKEYKKEYPNFWLGLLRAYGRILVVSIKNLF